MLFLLRVSFVFFISIAGVYATTLAVPIEDYISLDSRVVYQTEPASAVMMKTVDASPPVESSSSAAVGVSQPVLLLRISFTNQDFSYSRDEFQRLMFATQEGAVSVAGYYLENSYQQFHIQPAQETEGVVNDGIIDVRLPYEHPNFGEHYGSKSQALVRDALAQIKGYIDLEKFDRNSDAELSSNELAVVLMVAGYENAYGGDAAPEPRIWAHKSDISGLSVDGVSLTEFAMFGERHQNHLATIGIISHEMGHLLFALPDLYDRQGDSNGIGRWGLMGLGSWNARGGYSGSAPAHMMAWSKEKAGFLQPEDVMGDEHSFTLGSATLGPESMRIWLDPFRHGEHFLLEFRQQRQMDRALPGEGLLISHIDDWVGYGKTGPQNDVAEHKLVDIEEADGQDDLDQMENRGDRLDVYNDAYGQNYFGSASQPASMDYHGNMSGVEISDIQVGNEVKGMITLPYQQLGDNLGYDDIVGVSWGVSGRKTESLIEYFLGQEYSWAHGIDIFIPGSGEVVVSLFSHLEDGHVSGLIYSTELRSVTKGWNRIAFPERVDLSDYSKVYLQVTALASSGRPFSIDAQGIASGFSYTEVNGSYQKVRFDFNQRLLVANQQEAFSYQVPKAVGFSSDAESRSSGGGYGLSVFSFILLLIAFSGVDKSRSKVLLSL